MTVLQTTTRALVVLAALALQARPAAAQLDELVRDALRRNGGLEAERLHAEGAASQARAASALLLPSVTVESRYSEQDGTLNLGDLINPAYAALNQLTGSGAFPTNVDLTLPLRHESRVRITQPVFVPALWANRSAAGHASAAQQWQVGVSERRLAASVQVAYLRALSARQAAAIHETALVRATEAERVAQRLVDAGRATPDAVFRARADRAEAEQRLAEARQQASAAQRAVNQLAGRDFDAALDAIGEATLLRELPVAREEAAQHALARREELKQLESGVRAAESGARAAGSTYLPSVAVALDYGVQGREVRFGREHDYVVGSVVVSWNAFDGGGGVHRRSAARAEAASLQARRADVASQVRLDALEAWDAAVVARQAIATAEARLAAAQRAWELVRRRHEEGVASQVEVVDASQSLTAAELNRTLTVHEYAVRWVELERAAALRETAR